MPRRKYKNQFWLILCLSIVIFLTGGGWIVAYLIRYSATSENVCGTCHPEILKQWKNSTGHPAEKTSCSDCHSEGHRVFPNEWNVLRFYRDQIVPPEFFADENLTSSRCLECHEDVLDLNHAVKKKVIKFTHRIHFEESLRCVDCHRNAGHEDKTDGTNRPTISQCLPCHLKEFLGPPKSLKCLNCHDVMLAPGKSW